MSLSPATLPTPNFQAIDLSQLQQQIEQHIANGQQFLSNIVAVPQDFADKLAILQKMDELEQQMSESWGILSHLNAVMSNDDTRAIYQAILPNLSNYYTQIGQHEVLYQNYQQLFDDAQFATLNPAQQRAVELALRDFKLSGVDLATDKKQRFAEISSRLSQLSSDFSNHVLDATQAYYQVLDDAQLAGLPDSSIALLQQYGQQKGETRPVATLDFPAYLAVMTYADDRKLREQLYQAYVTRASELGDSAFDNTDIMQEILALRQEMAELVGFKHYGEYSLASKMAKDVDTVRQFLIDLAQHARQPAEQDIAQLQELAQQYGIDELKAWDLTYLSEKLKQKQFNLSQEALKPYFPLPKVLSGLFAIVEKIYGVQIVEKSTSVWHDDAQYFELLQNDEVLGGFYFDLYARQGKRGGAWMSGFRSRAVILGQLQKPICFMVGNFNPPIGEQPALLTHDEVITLFHEFGHGLHHLLTEVDNINVAGTHGVAWDAVELPSQFMEFWAWDNESLALLSEHIETKQPLPQDILQALLNARHFQTGLQTLRQLEFALFDLNIHCTVPALSAQGIQDELNRIRCEISVTPMVDYNRFQHSFSHIFAGGYACGYYSYKWAEVLASDAFARFEQEGIFNRETGKQFRDCILAVGGQVDALTAFKNFRGREPNIDALLRHQGWK
ncbi:M3 family metallopeptidase [Moraxella sp. ZY210820]|uniref:M3 family metallopeptidase n=1 Tax=unclassified Moraxella TaxID=2685852 RepID=UPI0027301F1C|nr:M3 family metallopeptidase [Moraxella sp. ZY210820]WLF84406.1 M3 family metallopeptidase [Moraxella sp. ZY210820]